MGKFFSCQNLFVILRDCLYFLKDVNAYCCWQQEGHNLENAFSRQAKMAALQIVQTNLCILILGYTILFLTFYYLLG